jgi:hypothetical protein
VRVTVLVGGGRGVPARHCQCQWGVDGVWRTRSWVLPTTSSCRASGVGVGTCVGCQYQWCMGGRVCVLTLCRMWVWACAGVLRHIVAEAGLHEGARVKMVRACPRKQNPTHFSPPPTTKSQARPPIHQLMTPSPTLQPYTQCNLSQLGEQRREHAGRQGAGRGPGRPGPTRT